MAWNHHVHFELHGICSVLQGKGDFAIQEVKIAQNQEVQNVVLRNIHHFISKSVTFAYFCQLKINSRKIAAFSNRKWTHWRQQVTFS